MAVTYENCKGKTFHLHRGHARNGNTRYFFSSKTDGELVDSIPDGYEIYEKK